MVVRVASNWRPPCSPWVSRLAPRPGNILFRLSPTSVTVTRISVAKFSFSTGYGNGSSPSFTELLPSSKSHAALHLQPALALAYDYVDFDSDSQNNITNVSGASTSSTGEGIQQHSNIFSPYHPAATSASVAGNFIARKSSSGGGGGSGSGRHRCPKVRRTMQNF